MRAIITTGTEDFTLTDLPTPEPGAGEIRIRVTSASVNPVDVGTANGLFHRLGIIPAGAGVGLGWDVSGVVDAVGTGVTGLPVGTPVAGLRVGIGPAVGTYTEALVLPADAVATIPAGLDPVAAAAIPLITHTAAQAIEQLDPHGRRLLVVGASGGVGGCAVPLADRAGAVVSAVGKPDDVDALHRSGATTVVTDLDSLSEARFDAVFDPAGVGADLLDLIVDGGQYLGTAPGAAPTPVRAITSTWIEVHHDGAELAGILADVASGALPLRVAGELPLEEAAQAHKAFAAKTAPGRWLLTV